MSQKWFFAASAFTGCRYYRQSLPLRHLYRSHLMPRGVRVHLGTSISQGLDADAIFFSRNIGAENLAYVLDMKRRGKLIVWDFDDDLFIPERWVQHEKNPMWVHQEIAAVRECVEVADLITVSTEGLKRAIGMPEKTFVCGNAIDLREWPFVRPSNKSRVYGRRILYAGTQTHTNDLGLVRRMYERSYRGHEWVFFGCTPRWARRATCVPLTSLRDYPRLCRDLHPDICLAPLVPDRFNDSKSPIKVWEMATTGGVVVASNVGPYRGHPSAVVPASVEFRDDHIDLAEYSHMRSRAVANENSWTSPGRKPSSQRKQWEKLFEAVRDAIDCHRGAIGLGDPLHDVVNISEAS